LNLKLLLKIINIFTLITVHYSLHLKNNEEYLKEVAAVVGYKELAQYDVFSIEDVKKLRNNNVKTAYSLLDRLMKKDWVRKIRKEIYSCVNPATGQVIASRYQIASAVTDTAYISHHSAFEFYGLANQVYYIVYISSETKFRDFEFENITYKYVHSKSKIGVVEPKNTPGVTVTDLERTVIDNIKDFKKIGGIEELLNCLENVNFLDESKLKSYLEMYDMQVLYQKTGYLLSHYKERMQLSDDFFEYCKSKIEKSTRYLLEKSNDENYYNNKWKLVVPNNLFSIKNQSGDELV
jgi:predicted transcriptional regulator of viral defense system